VGTDAIPFATAAIHVGLATTSHDVAAVSVSTFTNVGTTGNVRTATSPALARAYIHGEYIDEVLAIAGGSAGTRYVHANRNYSPTALTDSAGAVIERYRYDAYGNRTVTDAAGATRAASSHGFQRGFTGYHLDQETGLYFARSRMYSAALGRFTNRDPNDRSYVDGMSLYAAYFAPHGTDPFGMKDCSRATKPKDVSVSSGDIDHSGQADSIGAGSAGTLGDLVTHIESKLGICDCLRTLTITAHANPDGLWIRGRHAGETWNDPAVSAGMGTGGTSTVLDDPSAKPFGHSLVSRACFCSPCTIWLLGCNAGLGSMPQTLANATGCTVNAPQGYCYPNARNPGGSKVVPSIPAGDPHHPGGLPAYPGAGSGFGSYPPNTPPQSNPGYGNQPPKPQPPKPPKK
jgi:RHS repeat-associated protein